MARAPPPSLPLTTIALPPRSYLPDCKLLHALPDPPNQVAGQSPSHQPHPSSKKIIAVRSSCSNLHHPRRAATQTMAFTPPTPQTWTLRLKSHKTTVLLHVDPLQTFSSIKEQLFAALSETGLKPDAHSPTDLALPASPSDIELGRPVDVQKPHQGFQLGEWEYAPIDEEEVADDPKGKGKAKAGRPKKSVAVGPESVKDCPKGAGLRDGAVLAFRWKGEQGDVEEGDGREVDMWGVKLASYDDSYGVTNEMDVGGAREFEG